MNKEKLIIVLNPWRMIDYIDKLEEELDYHAHLSMRLINTTASEMLMLDAAYEVELNPEEKSYAIYVDTRWSDKGFMKAVITEDTSKNIAVLYQFLPHELVSKLLLSIGEDNLWNLVENAGIRVIFTVPLKQYKEIEQILQQSVNEQRT